MVESPKKDPTKSITWLSLDFKAKEKIIRARNAWGEGVGTPDYNSGLLGDKAFKEVHEALGLKVENIDHAVLAWSKLQELKDIGIKGGVFDEIRAYLAKFNAIMDVPATFENLYKQDNISKS